MRYALLALLALVSAAPAAAQMHVDIGIRLPAPPPLVVVPGVATVQYAPSAPANVFFYSNQYWIYADSGWHVSRRHDGPWILVAPQFVPRPVLLVPVRYYHVPPGHWKQWQRERRRAGSTSGATAGPGSERGGRAGTTTTAGGARRLAVGVLRASGAAEIRGAEEGQAKT